MTLQPQTFEEAKAQFKPLRRSEIRIPSQRLDSSRKPLTANRIKRKRPMGKKVKRRKRLTDGQLKKRVWKEFSIFIRTREADPDGFTTCVTCGERKQWKETQAGHFIRGRLNANLFEERGCWAQCHRCNIHLQGNVVLYYKFMQSKFGQEVIDELLAQNEVTRKWRPGELKELLEHYQSLNLANPLLAD